jgi:hypothetical protein
MELSRLAMSHCDPDNVFWQADKPSCEQDANEKDYDEYDGEEGAEEEMPEYDECESCLISFHNQHIVY